MSTQRRRDQIDALREEGFAARHSGRALGSNPHRELDAVHWHAGWMRADSELMELMEPEPSLLRQCPYCGNNLSKL
jgi:hypothetical protein